MVSLACLMWSEGISSAIEIDGENEIFSIKMQIQFYLFLILFHKENVEYWIMFCSFSVNYSDVVNFLDN